MKSIKEIVVSMNLEDKIALCEGANFWQTKAFEEYGIPAMFMCDGPHGLRKQERMGGDMMGVNDSRPATCFPAGVTTASSWDPELLTEIGKAIGEEAKDQGVGLVLGPGANIKRSPLCGRNFEYFSEDPYLAGKLAAGFIRGVEGEGVGTSLKHFAANSQELSRFNSDSVMDERTLREVYLTAFETAVKEGKPSTLMCAYPKLNGAHCSDHKQLLTDILRDEWGFEGFVVTDWGAMSDRIEAFRAGCDLSMPGGSGYMEKDVLKAVKDGSLPESAVDASAERILKLVFRSVETLKEKANCDYEKHHALAKRAACEGAVLLKNEGKLLPVNENAKLAVIGHMAKEPRYQGAGSSHINAIKLSIPLDFLPGAVYAPGCDARGDTTDELIAEAVAAAKNAEIAIVFAGLPARYESEGFDRDDMNMPEGHIRMIEAVAAANPNTAVVLLCGSAVETPWADKVKAILYMGLPGQAGGEATADLLCGKANPCGKLAESWPISYADCVSAPYYAKIKDALYYEGVYVGYRYYDKAGKPVRFPFGFGLSYTTFEYSDLTVNGDTVSVTVKNKGYRAGKETVQLYIEAPQTGLHRPLRELKRFAKVSLAPGEAKTVSFTLDERCFAVWVSTSSALRAHSPQGEGGGWRVQKGEYSVLVGPSSRDLPLKAKLFIEGEDLPAPEWQKDSFYENCQGTPTQALLEAAMGRKYVPNVPKKGSFTMDNSVEEMKDHSFVMKLMYKAIERRISKGFGGKADYENPEFRMMMTSSVGSTLRSIQTSGGLKDGLMQGVLDMANGHFFRGIGRMIKG